MHVKPYIYTYVYIYIRMSLSSGEGFIRLDEPVSFNGILLNFASADLTPTVIPVAVVIGLCQGGRQIRLCISVKYHLR